MASIGMFPLLCKDKHVTDWRCREYRDEDSKTKREIPTGIQGVGYAVTMLSEVVEVQHGWLILTCGLQPDQINPPVSICLVSIVQNIVSILQRILTSLKDPISDDFASCSAKTFLRPEASFPSKH